MTEVWDSFGTVILVSMSQSKKCPKTECPTSKWDSGTAGKPALAAGLLPLHCRTRFGTWDTSFGTVIKMGGN